MVHISAQACFQMGNVHREAIALDWKPPGLDLDRECLEVDCQVSNMDQGPSSMELDPAPKEAVQEKSTFTTKYFLVSPLS